MTTPEKGDIWRKGTERRVVILFGGLQAHLLDDEDQVHLGDSIPAESLIADGWAFVDSLAEDKR